MKSEPHSRRRPGAARRACRAGLALLLDMVAGCGKPAVELDASSMLAEGWDAYRLGEYRQALDQFARVLETPGARAQDRLHALYGQAVTWDLRQPVPSQDDALAAGLYRQIMEQDPAHDLAAWSALALARMIHLVPVDQEPDYVAVRAAYQEVMDRHPRHLASEEALIYQQSTLVMTLESNQTRQAVARLEQFVREQPEARFASAAFNLLAQAYETLGLPEQQLEARLKEIQTVEVDPASPAASDLSGRYWQLATTAEFVAGRFDVAREYYRKLIEEYPLDFRKFGAKQALERMDRLEQRLRAEAAP